MLTVAYLANQFPSAVEPYVGEEIEELRRRGIRVIACSVRKPLKTENQAPNSKTLPDVILQRSRRVILILALWLCVRRWKRIMPLVARIAFRGSEGLGERFRALSHTALGACLAVRLEKLHVDHIHVHHGYFGSWIAMAAARLLGVEFSMTLHGSDLLLHGTYLDLKLENCSFCLTVSEYNRNFILQRYPTIHVEKISVARLGVEAPEQPANVAAKPKINKDVFTFLAVGRLHAVKDHAFLIRACAQLRQVPFECLIVGDGPEWRNLESLIRECDLSDRVTLVGDVAHENLDGWYDRADLVVLTSRSEGIPLVLMEAMARRKIVLAPAITGIPELVIAGKTGFLYEAGSLDNFLVQLLFIRSLMQAPEDPRLRPYMVSAGAQLDRIRRAAELQVRQHFDRAKNLASFGDLFLQRISSQRESSSHENFILQQI